MNSLEFDSTKNGGISCKVNLKGKHVKTIPTRKTIPLLHEIEEELFREGFDISRINNSLVIDSDNDRLIFNNFELLRDILEEHTPYLLDEMNNYIESTSKRRIVSTRKALLRTGFVMSIIAAGLHFGAIKLSPDVNNLGVVQAVNLFDTNTTFKDIPIPEITEKTTSIREQEIYNTEVPAATFKEEVYTNTVDTRIDDYTIDIDCKENSQVDEIVEIQNRYREIAEKVGSKWGVSPNLILGMLTQESHGESSNLMQLQSWSIADEVMTVYNYDKGVYQKIVVTSNPNKYTSDVITISKEELNNSFTNISVATALYRHILNTYANGNPIAAIEIYNKGIGNFNKNVRACSRNTGISESDLISDFSNTSYLDYSGICGQGDPNYVANIMQYVDGNIQIKMLDENEQEYLIDYTINKTQEKELSR